MSKEKEGLHVWKSPAVGARDASNQPQNSLSEEQVQVIGTQRLTNEVRRFRNGVPKSPAV